MGVLKLRQHVMFWVLALLVGIGCFAVVNKTLKTDAATGINKTINFQGKMTNSNGTNVANGTYTFVFRIYTVGSGGSAVWTETDSLTVTDGIFQVNLGAVTALPGSVDFNTDNIYLGITFNSDPAGEMSPRVQLTASPYSFNTDKLDGLDSSAFLQLSPSGAQTGNINITGNIAASGTLGVGGQLTVGTSDTTGTLLVLDTKTGSGDPTGVNGGLYYNSNANKFRCYENSTWADCIGSGGGGGITTVGTIDSLTKAANGAVISGGSIVMQTADGSNPGLVSTGTQTFAGDKSFTGAIAIANTAPNSANGAGVNVATSLTSSSNTQLGLSVTSTASPGSSSTQTYYAVAATALTSSSNIGSGMLQALSGAVGNVGGGTVDRVTVGGYSIVNAGGGTITTARGIDVYAATNNGTISNLAGINIRDQTVGGNNTNLLVGTGTIPTGNFSIYNASAYSNVLVGNTRIGSTAAPSVALDVTGAAAISGQLSVGTSDTTGTLLVLDTKTGAGDPTGADGAMYYNSNAGKFRCYQAGAWADCINAGGGGGITTVGSIDTTPTAANGARISGSSIFMQYGDATYPGLVSTTTQIFAGNKTFNGTVTVANITPTANLTLGTSDVTGSLLVLDDKTGAGDPTGVNGGMYYNSNSSKFRCYQASAWTDCIATAGTGDLTNGGNTGAIIVGTNNSNTLTFETNNTNRFIVSATAATLTGNGATAIVGGSTLSLTSDTTSAITLDSGTTGDVNVATGTGIKNVNIGTGGTGAKTVIVGSTASTGATTLQSGSGGLLLKPSGANVTVGTSDITGTLLVLDDKTGAGDPTGVNGGMYYNSNSSKFRCYQASAWTDCIGSGGGGGLFTDAGTQTYLTSTTDELVVGGSSSLSAKLAVVGTSDQEQLLIRAYSGQTNANPLILTQDSTGAELFRINASNSNNLYMGYQSGNAITSGDNNAAFGGYALRSNTSGSYNTGVGNGALGSNTSASYNTALGAFALNNLSTTGNNTAVGASAMQSSTGAENVAMGVSALRFSTGSYNIGIGNGALGSTTSGGNNVALGYAALYSNLTGSNNTAIGYQALQNSTSGQNIAVGYQAGDNITSGTQNIIIGYDLDAASATGSNQLNIAGLIQSSNYATGNLTIGTSDTTGQLLVVDTKTGAGDPTGVNGGIYYNSNSNKFRCYQGSAWTDCIGAGAGGGVTSLGTLNGGTANATGATISGTTLYLQSASASYAGLVDTTTQTFAGNKTFTGNLVSTGTVDIGGVTPAGVTAGKTSIGAVTDSGDENNIMASSFSSGVGGALASISVYVSAVDAAPNNKWQMAIYTDSGGSPGTLVAYSTEGTLTTGWNTASISATLTASTTYWYGYNTNSTDSSKNQVQIDVGSGSVYRVNTYTTNTWPASFGGATPTGFGTYSGYVTYTSGASAGGLVIDSSGNTNIKGTLTVGTSDTTGTLLVLDTKTGSGDPTGVNGGMYYNSNAAKFRCYQASAWVDCIGSSLAIGSFSGSSQANGATYSAGVLTFGPADGTNPGMVSTGTQTLAGAKTFSSNLTVSSGSATLGTTSQAGSLVLWDGSGNTVSLNASGIGTNYALTLPTGAGAVSQCLQTDSVTASQLIFGSCTSGSGDGGVLSVGGINSQTKSGNGAVVVGTQIFMQTADATNVGLVSITAQDFAGAKTFKDGLLVGTSDATGTLLVLDDKTGATDPTGVNGGMYYNSGMGKFRCYEGSVWKNCIDPPANASIADQAISAAATAYLTGSNIAIPAGGVRAGSMINWRVVFAKTNVSGVGAGQIDVRFGTAGTTADTARCTLAGTASTAVVDSGVYDVTVTVRSVSASGVIQCNARITHSLSTTGLLNVPTYSVSATSATFDNTVASSIIGLSFTSGAGLTGTVSQVQVTTTNL